MTRKEDEIPSQISVSNYVKDDRRFIGMAEVYDDWERLVEAVLKREQLRQLARCPSLSSSTSDDVSSRQSFDSSRDNLNASAVYSPAIPSYCNARPMLLKDLKRATKNFQSDFLLGRGGLGTLYKGWLQERTPTAAKPGSGIAIAVRKWDQWRPTREEWLEELNYLNQLRHPNLIKLISYCSEEDNLFLVYEFMAKGSLDYHLHKRNISLSWAVRIKVAKGAARAVAFLHSREIPIIHGGLKTANILLDNEFNAKLSDFELARDGSRGEMAYVYPQLVDRTPTIGLEYATDRLTTKCDVFSFGSVLLELLSGRHVYDTLSDDEEQVTGIFIHEWAKKALASKGKVMLFQIMDPKLEGQYPEREAYAIATLALLCLSVDPKHRPTMDHVLATLEELCL